MMKTIRRLGAALLFAAFSLPAAATTYSPDYTDLWYNANESGWGLNLIQQGRTIFATLYVYGTDTAPRWYSASDLEPVGTSQTQFTGQLYQSTGPYFGATSFDSNAVSTLAVGTMTITFTSPTTATLQYTINGAPVTKNITRYLFRFEDLTGNYLGGLTATGSNCQSSSQAGPILIFQTLTVQQASQQVSMNVQFLSNQGQASSCTFAGAYSQAGRLGTVQGTWNCTVNGQAANAGNFTMSAIDATQNGFTGKFHGNDQFCNSYDGQFGGVRDVPM